VVAADDRGRAHAGRARARGGAAAVEAHVAFQRTAASGAHDPTIALRAEAVRVPITPLLADSAPAWSTVAALLTVGIELR
jgi:hypothetical protein